MQERPTNKINAISGPAVMAAIEHSLNVATGAKVKAADLALANIGILEAAMQELRGPELARARRSRDILKHQISVLRLYGVAA